MDALNVEYIERRASGRSRGRAKLRVIPTRKPCPSVVRIAGPADYQEVWRLMLMAHNENGIFPLTAPKVDWWLGRVLAPWTIPDWDAGPRGVIGVIGDVGKLEGLAFVVIDEWWYSTSKVINELLVYIDPECRSSSHARTLVSWMKAQSEQMGVPVISGIISNHRTEAKCRLYGGMLEKIGEFFVHNLTPATTLSSAA
jgi:hypothetical protein